MVRERELNVVVAPNTLLEVLRSPRKSSRLARARLLARNAWTRLPTEAFLECSEMIQEIRRLRPQWATEVAPTKEYLSHQRFWASSIWEAARRDAIPRDVLVFAGLDHDGEQIVQVQRDNQQVLRSVGMAASIEEHAKSLLTVRNTYPPGSEREALAAGWAPQTSVEPWREETHAIFWRRILEVHGGPDGDTTYIDWLTPWVDLEQVRADKAGFGRMVLYEAHAGAMLRNWLRWAVRYLQAAARVQPSNPRDEALASHLPDADLFITNDKAFARVLSHVTSVAPGQCAHVVHAAITKETVSVADRINDVLDAREQQIAHRVTTRP